MNTKSLIHYQLFILKSSTELFYLCQVSKDIFLSVPSMNKILDFLDDAVVLAAAAHLKLPRSAEGSIISQSNRIAFIGGGCKLKQYGHIIVINF